MISIPQEITVEKLFKMHLEDVDERIAAGRLSKRTRNSYLPLQKLVRVADVADIPLSSMAPIHFAAIQRKIENSGNALRTQKSTIIFIKSVFNWAHGMELVDRLRFGPRFVPPTEREIEIQRKNVSPSRFIDKRLILAALDKASPVMKVAILFGINCGFYPIDSIAITFGDLHLKDSPPYHDMERVKTKSNRMAVLWPETITAIEEYVMQYRIAVNENEQTLLLNQYGRPYSRGGAVSLIATFGDLLEKRVRNVSLGSLRHTYATVIDSIPDQTMIDLTMGHTNKSLQKRVYRQMNLNELGRLKVIADQVRAWLYGMNTTCEVHRIINTAD